MSLNFACQILSLEQILKCSFELTKTEIKLLKLLSSTGEKYTIKSLKNHIRKDRSTIQRSVKALTDKELINRHQINLDNGGYYFVYSAIKKELIKEKIYDIFSKFRNSVGSAIENW